MDKLAFKRLTASDLTFFEWHYRNHNAGNQKAINLNADVFTDQLYPALEVVVREHRNKLGIDLWIAGPAAKELINLQRKIIKGTAYKNWRLDGEFVHNPENEPERFNVLESSDIALFRFEGELAPDTLTLILMSKIAPDDQTLCESLDGALGDRRMMALSAGVFREMLEDLSIPHSHPAWLMIGDENLVEAAMGQAPAVDRLLSRPRPATLSFEDLIKARRAAEEIGQLGENLVDFHLRRSLAAAKTMNYEWISKTNAFAPYDFRVQYEDAWGKLEVKTTAGDFNREFYLSLNELREMAHGDEAYRIARVYKTSENGAKMRVSQDLRAYGRLIIEHFVALPAGVTPNGVTIAPDGRMFDAEIDLLPPNVDE